MGMTSAKTSQAVDVAALREAGIKIEVSHPRMFVTETQYTAKTDGQRALLREFWAQQYQQAHVIDHSWADMRDGVILSLTRFDKT